MPDLDPFLPAKHDAQKLVKRVWYRLVDFVKTYVTVALLKTLGVAVVALVAAAFNFPVFAFVAIAVEILALAVFVIYATKLLKAQDREARWTYVAGKARPAAGAGGQDSYGHRDACVYG